MAFLTGRCLQTAYGGGGGLCVWGGAQNTPLGLRICLFQMGALPTVGGREGSGPRERIFGPGWWGQRWDSGD